MLTWAFKVIVAIIAVIAVVFAINILLARIGLPADIVMLVQILVGLGLLIVAIRYIGMPPGSGDV